MASGNGIGMTHVRVDVDRFPNVQHDRIVELRVHLDGTFEDMDEFLTGMADEVAKFGKAPGTHALQNRDHALAAQFQAQIMVVTVRRIHPDRVLDTSDTAARGYRLRRLRIAFSEQLRHGHAQTLTDLQQLVVGQRQTIVLDL